MYPAARRFGCRTSTVIGCFCTIAGLSVVACMSTAQDAPLTICQLAKSPGDFVDKTVRVTAVFKTDMMHFGSLSDPDCPGVFMKLFLTRQEPHDPSVDELHNALEGPVPSVDLRVFRLDATGIFKWDFRLEPMPRALDGIESPRGEIYVDHVLSYKKLAPNE